MASVQVLSFRLFWHATSWLSYYIARQQRAWSIIFAKSHHVDIVRVFFPFFFLLLRTDDAHLFFFIKKKERLRKWTNSKSLSISTRTSRVNMNEFRKEMIYGEASTERPADGRGEWQGPTITRIVDLLELYKFTKTWCRIIYICGWDFHSRILFYFVPGSLSRFVTPLKSQPRNTCPCLPFLKNGCGIVAIKADERFSS